MVGLLEGRESLIIFGGENKKVTLVMLTLATMTFQIAKRKDMV
jgi:hypothetical protein